MWIVYAFIIFVGLVACALWALACYGLYRLLTPKRKVNPYKAAHLAYEENDRDYEAYLEWLKNSKRNGVPLGKVKSNAEKEADKKIKSLL